MNVNMPLKCADCIRAPRKSVRFIIDPECVGFRNLPT